MALHPERNVMTRAMARALQATEEIRGKVEKVGKVGKVGKVEKVDKVRNGA
jgi:hypothetical protein